MRNQIKMEIGLKALAVVLLGIAAYFYSTGQSDYTLAAAAFGICAFFLSMRFAIKRRLAAADASKTSEEDEA
ncbi:MAG: hypothetical protein KA746_08390 [Pyrinomonadaceae bacterium]|nr:hypothetical protein [Pyrinomonadaceae bacterium]MBP6212216.1 hypothetical protein [Pyrinomonadaceae bacterium]